MSLDKTTVLIIGAGPTGLATAISLIHQGYRDLLIVEETSSKGSASRAMTIHAATLEALDSIGCAESLIQLGIKGKGMHLSDRSTPFLSTDFTCLAPYTRFPFVLLISQSVTESVLISYLEKLGVSIIRPEKAVGLKSNDDGDLEVSFESGKVIKASYVVGADGAKSTIRQMAGVGFNDPDGMIIDEALGQMILADVIFSSPSPHLPHDTVSATGSGGKFFLIIPLPTSPVDSQGPIYRVGFNVPVSSGSPPQNPSTSYIQEHIDEQGPTFLSSDSHVNPSPIHISKTIWSTRFRTHAALADRFLVHMDENNRDAKQGGGIVLLVGDAAHIHAPAGGLGMNLGIRDAISLGEVLAAHLKSSANHAPNDDNQLLHDFASTRRERAATTIRLTKRIMFIAGVLGSSQILKFNYWFFRLIARIPAIQRMMAWNLSGLGNR